MNLIPAFDRLSQLNVRKLFSGMLSRVTDRLLYVADEVEWWKAMEEHARAEHEEYAREQERIEEAWAAMSPEEKAEILDEYSALNAMGRLGDVPFDNQWAGKAA